MSLFIPRGAQGMRGTRRNEEWTLYDFCENIRNFLQVLNNFR